MSIKKALALCICVDLVLGMCPLPHFAHVTAAFAEESQATDPASPVDDAGDVESDSSEEPPAEEGSAPAEVAAEDVVTVPYDAHTVMTAQSGDDDAPDTTDASPELTMFLQASADLPSRFDLRDRGVVTPVKKQSPWGYCWAHGAIAAAETSILTTMGSTYAETGLDLSERHLAWYVTSTVTEAISPSQVGEGLYPYDTNTNSVFDFGGREQCAATLFAQGIGPMSESDYPCRGANGTLASDDYLANSEAYIQERTEYYKNNYWYLSDEEARSYAEQYYNSLVERYKTYDAYSPYDDWSITEPDEPGSGRLRGSAYTLTDNNVLNYWARLNDDGELDAEEHFHKQPLCKNGNYIIWQDTIDQIKTELYEGRGISVGTTIKDATLNTETWSAYDPQISVASEHVVCIVGWDDDYAASNFTDTPPGDGAWIAKNSWGSETDAVAGGLTAADGTSKDAHAYDWGIVDESGKHTGYYYISYYDGTLNVPETFSFRIEPNNDQQDALQLDYLPASAAEYSHVDENPMWEANVFTLEKDMRIDEVATRLRISEKAPLQGFTCTFALYKLSDDATKPDDGTLLSTLTRTFQTQGYHRVALDSPVYLKAGDHLGIVVQQTHVADDGTTIYGIESQECDGYRKWHRDPVYGQAVVNEGESFYRIDGVTDKEEGSSDGWLDVMAPFSREMLLYLKPDLAASPDLLEWYVARACGNPMRDFFNIDNFGIKAFGEPTSLEHVDAVAPTCEEAGQVEHWVDAQTGVAYADENGTEPLEDVSVAALGHKWDAGIVTVEPTCTKEGTKAYTCGNDKTHTKSEPIAALGHAWGEATYTWSEDGKTCTATRVCGRDKSHTQVAEATVTSEVASEPTATESGIRTYTATFVENWAEPQTRTETIPATGTPDTPDTPTDTKESNKSDGSHSTSDKVSGTSTASGATNSRRLAETGDEAAGPAGALALLSVAMLVVGTSMRADRRKTGC